MDRTKIACQEEVMEGQTRKFKFARNGRPAEGFLARFQGRLVAYENVCRHLPVNLDFNKGSSLGLMANTSSARHTGRLMNR